MTGPEHYAEAQRLAEDGDPESLACAQVHALLALTTAVIDAANAITTGNRPDDNWGITWESFNDYPHK